MEKLVLSILLVSIFFVGIAQADENSPDLDAFVEIIKKYKDMPYSEKPGPNGVLPEMAMKHPFCLAVELRMHKERAEIVNEALKSNPTIQGYLADFEMVPKLAPKGAEPTLVKVGEPNSVEVVAPSSGKGEKNEGIARPTFFSGETPIVFIKINQQDGSISHGSGSMKDVEAGDFVLSTTAFRIEDPRYQKTCWARVHKVHKTEVKEGARLGSLFYIGEEEGKSSKIVSTLSPSLSFYITKQGAKGERTSCRKLLPAPKNSQFVGPYPENGGSCWFSVNDLTTVSAGGDVMVNFDVELTGIYFVGESGSQIPVNH